MSDKIKRDIRDIDDFTKVELRGWGDITLTQGESCQLVVEASQELLEHLKVEVSNHTLIISFDDQAKKNVWKVFKSDPIHYAITLPKCESIKIAGKGSLTADTLTGDKIALLVPGVGNFTINALDYKRVAVDVMGVSKTQIKHVKSEALALSIKGTGKIHIGTVQADTLAATIKGSGTIQVAGQVHSQAISMPGVGNYDAEYLQTESTNLISNGMTNSTLWAKEALRIQLRGMGNVRYYGNPTLAKKIRGIGRIKHLGEAPVVKV